MTTTPATIQLCPFCAHFGEEAQPIGNDFFGSSAKIGDVPACEECALIADICAATSAMLDWLADPQEAKHDYARHSTQ